MENLILPIIVGSFVGIASGYLGSFMILRRVSLVGDALSHVALPGVAIAILLNINPFIGAFSALFLGIVIIWAVRNKTKLPTETLVGILFATSLSIGFLIIPDEEVFEVLFGNIAKISSLDAIFAVIFSVLALVVTIRISRKLILSTLSPDIAQSQKINTSKIEFIFLLIIAVVIALGIKVVGTLLMGALVIIPAAASKNFTNRMKIYTILASFFGFISALGGLLLASRLNLPPGPIIVLVSAFIFLVSLFSKK